MTKGKQMKKGESIGIACILLITVLLGMAFTVEAAAGDINISWVEPGQTPGEAIDVTVGDSFRYDLHFALENDSQAWQAQSAAEYVQFRPAGRINYTSVARGALTETAMVWIVPLSGEGDINNVEGWFKDLAGSFNDGDTLNNTAGTVANITWYANAIGTATIYHNASRTSTAGSAGTMNFLRTNGIVRVHPQKPSTLAKEAEGATWVNLSWPSVNGSDRYILLRDTAGIPTGPPTGSGETYNSTATFYNDTDLNIEDTYYYSIYSWNATHGFYSLLESNVSKTSDDALPSTFTATKSGRTTVDLAWSCDTTGTAILRPNAQGLWSQWGRMGDVTYNYEAVDDVVPDNDTTYVRTDVSLATDYLNIQPYTDVNPIKEVTMYVVAKKDGGSETMRLALYDGITSSNESANLNPTTDYGLLSNTWSTNPFTEEPWESTDITDLQIGYKYTGSGSERIRVTQAYLEVTYYEPPTHVIERNTDETWSIGEGTEIYNGTAITYVDTGLIPGEEYYYQLWTYNSSEGAYSSTYLEANATTDGNTAPVLSAADPADNASNVDKAYAEVSITINDPDADTFNYTIEGAQITNVDISDATNGTYTATLNTPLSYDADIVWYVNVTDGYTWTNATYNFTVRSIYAPTAPTGAMARTVNRTAINVSWTGTDDRSIVERNTTDTWTRGQGSEIYNGSASYVVDTGLDDATVYYYQIWSYNETDAVHSSAYSETTNITEENVVPAEPTAIAPHLENYGSVYSRQLNVSVSDTDGDTMTVRLYWGNHTQIYYNTAVSSGGSVSISLPDYIDPDWLQHDTNYTWYATIDDGFDVYNSSTELGLFWFITSKAYDINEDGEVNVDDVSILAGAYGGTCDPGEFASDIIEDGVINVDDVSLFVNHYGWGQ